jgi:hypothetical protein
MNNAAARLLALLLALTISAVSHAASGHRTHSGPSDSATVAAAPAPVSN